MSYASTAYYADHLCERARLYVRRYFVKGTDPDFDQQLQTALDDLEKTRNDASKARIEKRWPKDTRTNNPQEKKAIKEAKVEDRKDTQKALRRHVFEEVKEQFEKFKNNRSKDTKHDPWLNPWNPSPVDTIFWM